MTPTSWRWETDTADWGVDILWERRLLSWWGADKPLPGVPAYAQGGGGQEQTFDDFLATSASPYGCPPDITAAIRRALLTPR